ncbi:tigger transposable element-derived 6-like [Brachionus plicatilis]|uniref:Tigger transposable element-derived 6-like n=1 Tax=Brachionus plicatilis TaxID=10195 RepID=A0A3M7SSE4_BRAPC|nr:tigger transposable element-derived 6-like [Brachionus plicatilis]
MSENLSNPVPKKRKCYSLETKIEKIKKHTDQKITITALAKEYNANPSTISTILASKSKLLEIGCDIQLQALKFATMLGHRDFKARNGWLCKFKERNGISLKTTIGEAELSTFEKKIDFEKYAYVSVDSNLAARGSLSDLQILNTVATKKEESDNSDSEIEELTQPKKSIISSKEAIERINDLKDLFLNKQEYDSSNIVNFLFNIENLVIEKSCNKQTTITSYVKKD